MDITLEKLMDDVGLKYDDKVILGKLDVWNFISEHLSDFINLDVSQVENSEMLYGYTESHFPIKVGFNDDKIQRIIIVTSEINYKRFKVMISYDGTNYSGFQIQKQQGTVQGEFTQIVSTINGEDTLVQGSSRTDAGVHALNYVLHFDSQRDLTADKWKKLLNNQLPQDIKIKEIKETHPIFHSRYDVSRKIYKYKLRRGERNPLAINYEWAIPKIDLSILEKNLKQLIGKHDFSSFYKGKLKDTVRTIYRAEMEISEDEISLIFEGNGFLRYMIRIIAFSLVEISSGKLNLDMETIMRDKSRKYTKHLAPPGGLYLEKVVY